MQIAGSAQFSSASINYDEGPLAQAEHGGLEYRLDAGHGSAVAISSREPGTWTWAPVAEGKWDGVQLKARGLDFALREQLSRALSAVMSEREEGL